MMAAPFDQELIDVSVMIGQEPEPKSRHPNAHVFKFCPGQYEPAFGLNQHSYTVVPLTI